MNASCQRWFHPSHSPLDQDSSLKHALAEWPSQSVSPRQARQRRKTLGRGMERGRMMRVRLLRSTRRTMILRLSLATRHLSVSL